MGTDLLSPPERLRTAYRLAEQGWAVIPVLESKRPAVTGWRTRTAAEALEMVPEWWKRWPDAWPGVRTGEGRLYVVDEDEPGSVLRDHPDSDSWPWEPSRTAGHRHARFLGGGPCKSSGQSEHPGWDLKGEGGMIVVWNGQLPTEAAPLPAEVKKTWHRVSVAKAPNIRGGRPAALNRLRVAQIAVGRASEGRRNAMLNKYAWCTVDFVMTNAITLEEWAQCLVEASVSSGYPEKDAIDVIRAVLRSKGID